MLVIKSEIWPRGDVASRFEIARIGIINRGGPPSTIADYNVVGIMARDRSEYVSADVVVGFPRHYGWQELVTRVLPLHGPHDMFHQEYIESVVELLKRG